MKRVPYIPTIIDWTIRFVFSCFIPHTAKIGKGLIVGYGGLGIVIHADAVIGDNVYIGQGVTIGADISNEGAPTIKNRVYIGSGAKILGSVCIGDEVIIGANAVVVSDIPSRCVAVGIPAKVI
ncbi:MAG: serine acetyltransferase [Pseudomonadota bacterium]